MKSVLVLALLFALALSKPIPQPIQTKEAWDDYNDPSAMLASNFETRFSSLPAQGELKVKPWSDTYWPSHEGGIAARWAMDQGGDEADAFKYTLHDLNSLKSMSQDDLKKLSPAEKFDIFRGLYNYPTVNEERSRTNPNCASWEGICHGWSPAALNFPEPGPVTLKNADGIDVPFAASDIKGLLDFYQGQVAKTQTTFLANRCNYDRNSDSDKMNDPECRDINAGSFHIAITNQIGIREKGFVADVTRDIQVWNQPVFQFATKEVSRSSTPSQGAAQGTVSEVTLQTDMTYGVEAAQNWNPIGTVPRTATYNYRVELDANDNIIGGEWDGNQWERPDFLWTEERPDFTGDWSDLGKIYGAATGANAMVFASDSTSAAASNTESSSIPMNHDLFVVMVSVGTTLAAVLVVLGFIYIMMARRPVNVVSSLREPLV